MKISFCGITGYKEFIAGKLDSSFTIISDNDFENSDIIYWIFGPGPDLLNHFKYWFKPTKAIIVHWIGSDVEYLDAKLRRGHLRKRLYYHLWIQISRIRKMQGRLFNFASAPWLVKELDNLGLKADYLPISSVKAEFVNYNSSPLAREYDFYSYLPYKSMSTYGGEIILHAAKQMISKKFILVMKDLTAEEIRKLNLCPNITALPKQSAHELFKIYLNTKCMLRFTRHDGLSMSVLEALAAEMQVLWSYSFPSAVKVDVDDFANTIEMMDKITTDWQPNISGHQYVKEHLSDSSIANLYKEKLNTLNN